MHNPPISANMKHLQIDNVGPILLERSRRAKRLAISVRSHNGVRVAVPYGVSFKKAEEFAREKTDWIRKHLNRVKEIEQERRPQIEIDRAAARRTLIAKLDRLAAEHGLTYNMVFFRNQRTRWGSCSTKNNISLNIQLVQLPDELIDYVILHELVHTRVKNHSSTFWDELAIYVVEPKKMSAKLRKYELI